MTDRIIQLLRLCGPRELSTDDAADFPRISSYGVDVLGLTESGAVCFRTIDLNKARADFANRPAAAPSSSDWLHLTAPEPEPEPELLHWRDIDTFASKVRSLLSAYGRVEILVDEQTKSRPLVTIHTKTEPSLHHMNQILAAVPRGWDVKFQRIEAPPFAGAEKERTKTHETFTFLPGADAVARTRSMLETLERMRACVPVTMQVKLGLRDIFKTPAAGPYTIVVETDEPLSAYTTLRIMQEKPDGFELEFRTATRAPLSDTDTQTHTHSQPSKTKAPTPFEAAERLYEEWRRSLRVRVRTSGQPDKYAFSTLPEQERKAWLTVLYLALQLNQTMTDGKV